MFLTKLILGGYAVLMVWSIVAAWRSLETAVLLTDIPLLLLVVIGIFLLDRCVSKAYLILMIACFVSSSLFLMRLSATQSFFPSGYLWLLSLMIALLCLIKLLQCRRT